MDNKEEIQYLSRASYYDQKAINILINMIKRIGIESYQNIVNNYNKSIMDKIESGDYPNNNDILMGASLDIFSDKTL